MTKEIPAWAQQTQRDIETLEMMPDEEVQYLTKNPKYISVDLEAWRRQDGTWEKLKMMRQMFKSSSPL